MLHLSPIDTLRLERGGTHLRHLGDRATAEFLTELARRIGGGPAILALLEEYGRLSPGMVRAAGADRFPPRPLRVVPKAEARA